MCTRRTRKDVAMEGLYSSLYGDWPRISPYCVMVVSGLGGGGGYGTRDHIKISAVHNAFCLASIG